MNDSFSFFFDILDSISSLSPLFDQDNLPNDVRPVIFPVFVKDQVRISKESFFHGKNMSDSLKSIGFNFGWNLKKIQAGISGLNPKQSINDEISSFFLYSFIAWYLNYEKNRDYGDIDMIFTMISFVYRSPFSLLSYPALSFMINLVESEKINYFPYLQILSFISSSPPSFILPLFYQVIECASQMSISIFLPFDEYFVFFESIGKYFEDHLSDLNMMYLSKLFKSLPLVFDRFGYTVLNLISSVSDILDHDTTTIAVEIICVLQVYIAKGITFDTSTQIIPHTTGIEKSHADFPLFFVDKPTFRNGLDFSTCPKLQNPKELKNLFPVYVYDAILQIVICCEKSFNLYQMLFLSYRDILNEFKSDRCYLNLLSLFVFWSERVSYTVNLSVYLMHFFVSQLYTIDETVFNVSPLYNLVNSLRYHSMSYIQMLNPAVFSQVISNSLVSPYLFADIMLQLERGLDHVQVLIVKEPKVLSDLVSQTMKYRNYSSEDNSVVDAIEKARLCFFSFLSSVIVKRNLFSPLLDNTNFLGPFLSFLFESPVRPLVCEIIVLYLTMQTHHVNHSFLVSLQNVLEISSSDFPKERAVMLFEDVLATLCNAISSRSIIGELFIPFSHTICFCMKTMASNEHLPVLFRKVITYFILMTKYYRISKTESQSFYCIVTQLQKESYISEKEIISSLIDLLAGSNILIESPHFIIAQCNILLVLLNFYILIDKLNNFMGFLGQLLRYNDLNIDAALDAELDTTLLQILYEEKQKEKMPLELYGEILDVFVLLAPHSTSTLTLQLFLSLLTSFNDKVLSIYQHLLSLAAANLFGIVSSRPKSSFLLGYHQLMIKTIVIPSNPPSFTFTFWAFLEDSQTNGKPILLRMNFAKHMALLFYFSKNSLMCKLMGKKDNDNPPIIDSVSVSKWVFGAFTCIFTHDAIVFEPFLDGKFLTSITIPPIPLSLALSPIDCLIGGCINVFPSPVSQIGAIGLFPPLSKTEVIRIYSLGVRNNSNVPNSLFYRVSFQNSISIQDSPHIDILVHKIGVEFLLPIFRKIPSPCNEGMVYNDYLLQSLEMLSNALMMGEEAQDLFTKSNGFKILYFLLKSGWTTTFRYDFYLKLSHLMQRLDSDAAKAQFFDYILTNNDLIMCLDDVTHIEILNYWKDYLFPLFPRHSIRYRSNYELLNLLRMYYWYEPVENGIAQMKESRSKTLDIKIARKCIFSIISSRITLKSIPEDFGLLFYHARTCEDPKQVLDLISFICHIIETNDTISDYYSNNSSFFSLFVTLTQIRQPCIRPVAIEIIVSLRKVEKFSLPILLRMTKVFTSQISIHDITIDAYDHLIQFSSVFPEILDICGYFAFILGREVSELFVEKYFSILSANPQCRISFHWVVVNCLYFNQMETLYEYISKLHDNDQYFCAFVSIRLISRALGFNDRIISTNFLHHVVNHIIEVQSDISKPLYRSLLNMSLFYIFWNDSNDPEASFIPLYRNSPFNDEKPAKNNLLSRFDITYMKLNHLLSLSKKMDGLYIGCRFDENGEWNDSMLAEKILQLFLKHPDMSFNFHMVLLLGFVVRSKRSLDYANFLTISQMNQFIESNSVLNAFIMKECGNNVNTGMDNLFDGPLLIISQLKQSFEIQIQQNIMEQEEEMIKDSLFISQYFKLNPIESSQEEGERLVYSAQRWVNEYDHSCKQWVRLWRKFKQERSTWRFTTSSESGHWKRKGSKGFCSTPILLVKIPSVTKRSKRSNGYAYSTIDVPQNAIIYNVPCYVMKINRQFRSYFSLCSDSIRISFSRQKSMIIPLHCLTHIIGRNGTPIFSGLEFYTNSNYSLLIDFGENIAINIAKKISELSLPNNILCQKNDSFSFFSSLNYTQQWRFSKLSNFDYIMALNMLSGRSFNSIDHYPIFPWVLSDFTQHQESFDFPSFLRDFRFPMKPSTDTREQLQIYTKCPLSPNVVIEYLKNIEPFSSLNSESSTLSIHDLFNKAINDDMPAELVPEYFMMPEAIEGRIPNVPWASNSFEFVYYHRKILESPTVSQLLHHWIDLVWGVKPFQSVKSESFYLGPKSPIEPHKVMPTALFPHAHQKKHIIDYSSLLRGMITIHAKLSPVVSSFIQEEPDYTYSITVLYSSGDIITISIDLSDCARSNTESRGTGSNTLRLLEPITLDIDSYDSSSSSLHYELALNIQKKNDDQNNTTITSLEQIMIDVKKLKWIMDNDAKRECIHSTNNGFYFSEDSPSNKLWYINTQNGMAKELEPLPGNRRCSDAKGSFFICGTDNSSVSLYGNCSKLFTIPSCREVISTCFISIEHSIIVSGTQDSSIIVSSLKTGSIINVIDINGIEPRLILVTPSWGFIIVYGKLNNSPLSQNQISIFTLNGTHIRTKEINFSIHHWYSWSSYQGFDYILMSNCAGKLYSCEAFFLNIEKSFYRCPTNIVSMIYSKDSMSTIVVLDDGRIHIIPHQV